ncbi:matrixin family metalloprotease [Myxacorys almedinensis]|uniref:Peptidase n=1 Tax=Myxacorys almedinensis A TaxID=2690445 RepID=A0A8J7Z1N7_9CYAN|nr:matrixin family metalloprotease [Myxacorys almedinensis]NDJ16531.1 peptidase [Myxacorys almedinensis A]
MNWVRRVLHPILSRHLGASLAGCLFLLLILCPAISEALPAAQTHPLPPRLAQWHDRANRGDYFERVEKTTPGYLVWSEFPVKVYVDGGREEARSQVWDDAVRQAVDEWSAYLPLQTVTQAQQADIAIVRAAPPLKFPPTQRVRSAETRFELYTKGSPAILYHRCSIFIQPSQADIYLVAAARHELGHALGIWGHSPVETDALYFSQVRDPLPISERDVNTLKRVYQQPTRLGWKVSKK